jgi:hypothetical protein
MMIAPLQFPICICKSSNSIVCFSADCDISCRIFSWRRYSVTCAEDKVLRRILCSSYSQSISAERGSLLFLSRAANKMLLIKYFLNELFMAYVFPSKGFPLMDYHSNHYHLLMSFCWHLRLVHLCLEETLGHWATRMHQHI